MLFTDIYVGWPGSVHDARVLRNSPLYQTAEHHFQGDSHLLGDSAYPLHRYVIGKYEDGIHQKFEKQVNKKLVPRLFALYCKLLHDGFKCPLKKNSFLATPNFENEC